MQLPVTLSTSEPEPNIAIIKIAPQAYGNCHPSPKEIFFLIEISDMTLKIDREEKTLIDARANIFEYWVLDVSNRQAYIYCYPTPKGYKLETILSDN